MSTKTRPKAAVRTGKGKAGRRPPVKVKRGRDIPLLPVAVGGVLLALAIALVVYIVVNSRPTQGPPTVASIPCDQLEHTQVHYHAALQIVYQGNVVNIPPQTGIVSDSAGNVKCFYWLHVHAANNNTIHIESRANQTFTLGQFFDVWNSWAKSNGLPAAKLDATHVGSFTLTPDQKIVVFIDLQDGKGAQPYTGDPRTIVLKTHEVITIEVTPPQVPPPSFTFASGL